MPSSLIIASFYIVLTMNRQLGGSFIDNRLILSDHHSCENDSVSKCVELLNVDVLPLRGNQKLHPMNYSSFVMNVMKICLRIYIIYNIANIRIAHIKYCKYNKNIFSPGSTMAAAAHFYQQQVFKICLKMIF